MAMVNVVTKAACRRIYWLRLVGLVQKVGGHVALCATFVIWTGWTLTVAVPRWQHHKYCRIYYYYGVHFCLLLL